MNIIAKKPVQIAILFYLVFLGLYFFNFHYDLSDDHTKWGTFGDFLGGSLNPIIGILTVVLTYDIIKGQQIENKQGEFKYMFQLLFNTIDENKNLIRFTRFGKTSVGRDAIIIINKNIENLYKSLNEKNIGNEEDNFIKAFWSVYNDINQSSSTYMKTLHNSLKVIDKFCLDDRQSTYSDLVRAQLHSEELKFILYNGLASDDFKSFKGRIEKYTILKDLAGATDIDQELKNKYTRNAYIENGENKKLRKITILSFTITVENTK